MAKELRISIVVTVADDLFEQATTIAAVRPLLTAFGNGLIEMGADFEVVPEMVTPRPREAAAKPAAKFVQTTMRGVDGVETTFHERHDVHEAA